MKLEKRPYETRAVRGLRLALKSHRKVLAVAPTGSGKTVIAALLVKQETRWRRVLWLAHRHELIDQAYTTLADLGLSVGVLMAQDERLHGQVRVDPGARVQVASVQTIAARGVPKGVELIVFDEAHRVMADSYQQIAKSRARADVLGLTATPCRMDGRGLGDFFQHMLVMARPSELYAQGYLAEPTSWGAGPETLELLAKRLRGVRTQHGDFAPEQLAAAVDRGALIGRVVSEAMRIAPGVPKVVFACGVRHSRRIAAEFQRVGIRAAHLDGDTDPADRERILRQLREGDLEVVSNVDVLGEGWDLPALGAVIVARPTKSLGRFLQMTGRVQRTFGGRVPIVIDHGGNVQRFNIVPGEDIEWSLETGAAPVADDPKSKECRECHAFNPWGASECGECGAETPLRKTPRQEREEVEAQLEAIDRAKLDAERAALRARIDAMAKRKNAPKGWAEKVFRDVCGASM